MYVYIFFRRYDFFPVFSLFKDQVTFLNKIQKWVSFQQGPRLDFSMKVNKMLQKLKNCYRGATRMELTLWSFAVF